MDINTLKRSACLFIAVMSLSSQAFAADNEVTFTGSILDSTCTVNVNGGQSMSLSQASRNRAMSAPLKYLTSY